MKIILFLVGLAAAAFIAFALAMTVEILGRSRKDDDKEDKP